MDSNVIEIFNDSLDAVGLNFIKYSHMPPNLKRTALSFDIHKQISDEINHGHILDERFYENEIYDFSEQDLESHHRIINACIALVCLGHTEYIKPLINYLDFPEARWTVKIDYILNVLLGTPVDHFRIPTHNEKINWQNEFILNSFYSTLNDLSQIILETREERPINYFDYVTNNINSKSLLNTSFRVAKSEIKDEVDCAEFYYINSYNYLRKGDYFSWIAFMNESIDETTVPFINTVAKSVHDAFEDLSIRLEFEFWKERIEKTSTGVLSSLFLYRIFETLFPNEDLAPLFLNTFISKDLEDDRFGWLYSQNSKENSIKNICSIYEKLYKYDQETKEKIIEVDPLSIYFFRSYLFNLYSSEKESLVLCSQHRKPGSKELFNSFKKRYNKNNEVLAQVSKLKDILSTNNDFYEKVSTLNERRVIFEITYLLNDDFQDDIKAKYESHFSGSVNKAVRSKFFKIKNTFFE